MSNESMRAWTETRVKTLVNASFPGIPIAFENVTFVEPKDAHFMELFILDGDSVRTSIGTRVDVHHAGVLQINISAPKGKGTVTQNRICDLMEKSFTGLQARLSDGATVVFRTARKTKLGDQGAHHLAAVSVAYTRKETSTALPLEP